MRLLITSICFVAFFAIGLTQGQEFKKADHILVPYGKDPRQVLHLWLPKTKSPAPLVLHFHGGGFWCEGIWWLQTFYLMSILPPILDCKGEQFLY